MEKYNAVDLNPGWLAFRPGWFANERRLLALINMAAPAVLRPPLRHFPDETFRYGHRISGVPLPSAHPISLPCSITALKNTGMFLPR